MLQIITAQSAWMKTKHKREAEKSREIISIHNLISQAASQGCSYVVSKIEAMETLVQLQTAGYEVSLISGRNDDSEQYLISWGEPAEMTVEKYHEARRNENE